MTAEKNLAGANDALGRHAFSICSAGRGDEDLTPLNVYRFTRLLRVLVHPPSSSARRGDVYEELDIECAGEAAQSLKARIVLGCLKPCDGRLIHAKTLGKRGLR